MEEQEIAGSIMAEDNGRIVEVERFRFQICDSSIFFFLTLKCCVWQYEGILEEHPEKIVKAAINLLEGANVLMKDGTTSQAFEKLSGKNLDV